MTALVSAVIPAYNYARFIRRAVDSVLAQTYPAIECIVVDDGSTDNTADVLASYGSRVRVIRQENRGLSSARNTGINAATGEFIAILDADDVWQPAKISTQMAAFEERPEIGAIGCGAELVNGLGKQIGFLNFAQSCEVSDHMDLAKQFRAVATRQFWVSGSGSGAMIRKRVFADIGAFDETLHAAEDWDMWLRIAAKYPIYNVSDVLVTIHQHGSGSFRNAEKMEHNQWKVYAFAAKRSGNLLDRQTLRRMRALILADAGGEYVFAKDYVMAARRYAASLREWPFHSGRWYRLVRALTKHFGL